MCGRTSLCAPVTWIQERFDARIEFEYRPRYNVAPRQDLAAIPNTAEHTVTRQNWGLIPPRADGPDDGPRPINARAETVAEKPAFRDAFAERRCLAERGEARLGRRASGVSEAGRCLVLADGFYEWTGERGHRQPYRICLDGNEPFAFAGLWSRWEPGGNGDAADDREPLETVTIVTTEANDVVAPIHDRMPAILEPEAEREWLHADTDRAQELLGPYAGGDLRAYPVSKRVNDPANDDPELLVEVAGQEQTGLEEFGT